MLDRILSELQIHFLLKDETDIREYDTYSLVAQAGLVLYVKLHMTLNN